MKRHGVLWPRVVAFDNLLSAYRKARRGKGRRPDVARFAMELESNLLRLQESLNDRSYRPGGYRRFTIYDRKPRLISAAPFRDRVVHHALMNPVEPLLDRRFIHDCYACRKGKGVHAAVDRYQAWSRRYGFVLKADVRGYFPSIDHQILKSKLARRIKDPGALWLFYSIIDGAPESGTTPELFPGDDLVTGMERRRGLPIGNLTSQFLGNLYLDDLDHFLKECCGVRAYLRYVDDLILLDDDKSRLWQLRDTIDHFLERERLRLHPAKSQVFRTRDGVNVLGYRVFPTHRRLRRDAGYRFRRRLKALARTYSDGRLELSDIRASIASWIGHARHADTLGLRRAVISSVSLSRERAGRNDRARGSRRLLERLSGVRPVGEPRQAPS